MTNVEKKKNLFYLIARVTCEVLIAKCVAENSNSLMVSDSKETEDEITELKNRVWDDYISDGEDKEVEFKKRITFAANETNSAVSFDDAVSNEPNLPEMQHSDAHRKWLHHGKERLKRMSKLKDCELTLFRAEIFFSV